jgi:hypothetical protein
VKVRTLQPETAANRERRRRLWGERRKESREGGSLDTLSAAGRGDKVVLVVFAGELLEGLALGLGKEVGRKDTGPERGKG